MTGFGEAKDVAVFGLDPGDFVRAMDLSQCSLESYLGVDAHTRSVFVESVEAAGGRVAARGKVSVAHDLGLMLNFQMMFGRNEV